MINVIISLNILAMHVTKISISFFAKIDMLITTMGIITKGAGMLGTIFGKEFFIIKRTSVFIERTRDNSYIHFFILNVNHV